MKGGRGHSGGRAAGPARSPCVRSRGGGRWRSREARQREMDDDGASRGRVAWRGAARCGVRVAQVPAAPTESRWSRPRRRGRRAGSAGGTSPAGPEGRRGRGSSGRGPSPARSGCPPRTPEGKGPGRPPALPREGAELNRWSLSSRQGFAATQALAGRSPLFFFFFFPGGATSKRGSFGRSRWPPKRGQ